jgi:hydrogenase expression/formation protein HypE
MIERASGNDRPGKVPHDFLQEVAFHSLGKARRSLVVGPGPGLDNAVVSLGAGNVLILTSDPLSLIPELGVEQSARLSVHLLASDLATSGVAPQFAMLDYNLPQEIRLVDVGLYLKEVGAECKRLGITIAGGHTGRYPGCGYTVVGGGTMLSTAEEDDYVTPAMATAGDAIVITKGAGVGCAAILAGCFPSIVKATGGRAIAEEAMSRLDECSTVRDSLIAVSLGLHDRVTSMHDATEGGVLGGLLELSGACGLPVFADREKIHVPKEAAAVCSVFGLDPLVTLSEGTLIITCRPPVVEELIGKLRSRGIDAYEVGKIGGRGVGAGLWLSSGGSKPRRSSPGPDLYWTAFSKAASRLRAGGER